MSQIVEANRIKEYQGRLERLKAEQAVILIRKKEILRAEQEVNKKINYIRKEIDDLSKDELKMSEHSILRWIEKVEVVHPNEVESRVITEELIRMWKILGNGCFPLGDSGFSAVIKNGVIVTIK